MTELIKVRIRGQERAISPRELENLSDEDQAELELLIDGEWVRPGRFSSDGSDLEFE